MLLSIISSSFTRPADTVAYASGDLVANSDGAFYLQGGLANPYAIPLGGMMPYIGSSAPNSAFAFPIGQAISRTTYATLFSLISTTFGSGDGSTTFNLPDLRGRVVAGLDNMGGSTAARLSTVMSSLTMGGTGGAQNQTIAQANIPNYNLSIINFNDPGHAHAVTGGTIGGAGIAPAGSTGFNTIQGPTTISIASATTGISFQVNSGGSGVALTTTQPTMVANFILRII